jgi:hypothetical protein
MLLEISEERFRSLSGFDLGWEMISGPIQQARTRSLAVKKEVYNQLTPGQKALFSFWVMYGHVQQGWLPFFQSGYHQYLPMLRTGLLNIEDQPMLETLDLAAKAFQDHENALIFSDTEAAQRIADQFRALDQRLFALLPTTMQRLENLIRAAPQEFVIFTS